MRDGQYSAAVAAIKEKGVLSGKRIERAERGGPGEFEWLENLSADQLRELINTALRDGVVSGDVACCAYVGH
jgi:hypothetical protein